eukprot:COSAG03_NODE_8137_length_833_cov_1.235695_2_plen_193_part_00
MALVSHSICARCLGAMIRVNDCVDCRGCGSLPGEWQAKANEMAEHELCKERTANSVWRLLQCVRSVSGHALSIACCKSLRLVTTVSLLSLALSLSLSLSLSLCLSRSADGSAVLQVRSAWPATAKERPQKNRFLPEGVCVCARARARVCACVSHPLSCAHRRQSLLLTLRACACATSKDDAGQLRVGNAATL